MLRAWQSQHDPGCPGAAAWALSCALNQAAPSDTSVNESPAQVPLRSLFSLNERQLMALAQCCLLHCGPVPHVKATFV